MFLSVLVIAGIMYPVEPIEKSDVMGKEKHNIKHSKKYKEIQYTYGVLCNDNTRNNRDKNL